MLKQRLFKKYFLATAFIVFFSLTVMMLISVFVFSKNIAASNYSTLDKTCSSVSNFATSVTQNPSSHDGERNIYYIMKNLSDFSDADIYFTDLTGTIRVCACEKWGTDAICDHSGSILPSEFIERAKSGAFHEIATLDLYSTPHYVSAQNVTNNGKIIGTVVAAAPMSATESVIIKTVRIYLFSAIVPLVLMFFALYGITYRLTKPLRLMSEAARAMAKGDFSRRIPVTSDDEIGELAVSFNQMTNSLAQLENMRKSFVANISHELKTPMTTIGGFIDGIIDGTIEPEKEKYYLEIVSDEVKRLSRMVQSMLNVSKLESGEFVLKTEIFDFRDLLINVVISQEQRIEAQSLNITGLDGIPNITVNADRDLIHQVVYNLVDNAVKFTDGSGNIDFSLKVDSKRMIFAIKNTGKGIPQAELPYIFERFYKVDKSRSANKNSTGLGLYIVKTIVKIHGGTIKVSSRENEYTVFEVTLPLVRQ